MKHLKERFTWYLVGIMCCGPLLLGAHPTEEFASQLWPGEGRPRFAAKVSVLVLHQDPQFKSPVAARVPIKLGAFIQFDDTWYRTVRPGEFMATADGVLKARRLGKIRLLSVKDYYANPATEDIAYLKGTTFEYLQYRAEGTCFIRLMGEVFDTDVCPTFDDKFQMIAEPVTEWWVRVVICGKPKGWLLIDENTVQFLQRQF